MKREEWSGGRKEGREGGRDGWMKREEWSVGREDGIKIND